MSKTAEILQIISAPTGMKAKVTFESKAVEVLPVVALALVRREIDSRDSVVHQEIEPCVLSYNGDGIELLRDSYDASSIEIFHQ